MISPIPLEQALELCEEIRTKNQLKRWPFRTGKMQCYFCWRFSKQNPEKLCFSASVDLRGCRQVNKLFDERQ